MLPGSRGSRQLPQLFFPSLSQTFKLQTLEVKAGDRPFVTFSVLDVIESLDAIIALPKDPVSHISRAATDSKMLTEIYCRQ